MKNKTVLAAAVVASVGGASAAADAASFNATLTEVRTFSNSGTAGTPSNITSSTATWSYNDVTNLLSQTGGTYNVRVTTAPTSTLFRHSVTGLVLGNGAAATAASFICTEGNFGPGVGASLCGNYTFGANFTNDSTTTWGPGTAVSRTIGGDDAVAGPQASIASLDGFTTATWNGTTLVLRNATCTQTCTTSASGFNNGQQWTFAVVPAPAAAWLFGGAVAVLASMQRRPAAWFRARA